MSLGMTCRALFEEAKAGFKRTIANSAGRWARQRLVLVGDYHYGHEYPPNLTLTEDELYKFHHAGLTESEDDSTLSEGERGARRLGKGEFTETRPCLQNHVEEHYEPISPLELMGKASNAVFLEIHKLREVRAIKESIVKQMLAMAFPTWHLFFPASEGTDYALCFPERSEYVLCSDVMQEYGQCEEDKWEITTEPRRIEQDPMSTTLILSNNNRSIRGLDIIGRCILGGLCLTDDGSGILWGGLRGPLAGVGMVIVPHSAMHEKQQHWSRISARTVSAGSEIRSLAMDINS